MPARVVTAAYRYLMNSGVPAALLAQGILGADDPGGAFDSGWVFSGDLTGDPYRNVEGSGKCAIVLYSYDYWSAPTMMHSARYPRLHVAIYADRTRTPDVTASPTRHDAESKAEYVFTQIDPLFHDNGNRIHAFDTLRVISTLAGGGFTLANIPNGDGAVRGDVIYDVTLD